MPLVNLLGTIGNDYFHTVEMGYSTLTDFRIDGGQGNDILRTSNGNDFVDGGKGEDRLYGGGGDDILRAGNHDDYVNGGRGNDYVSAGAGNDIVYAGSGSDEVLGGSGDDFIYGQKGYNTLDGGIGNDYIDSGRHSSTVMGGSGEDTLVADLSKGARHVLNGGEDSDHFVFEGMVTNRQSITRVEDFELGIDSFEIDGLNHIDLMADYLLDPAGSDITIVERDFGTVIRLDTNDSIRLEGITMDKLFAHYEDFIL